MKAPIFGPATRTHISRVLSFPNVTGWHVATLPMRLCQPPLLVASEIFKLQYLESLIGCYTQFVGVPALEGIDGIINLAAAGRKSREGVQWQGAKKLQPPQLEPHRMPPSTHSCFIACCFRNLFRSGEGTKIP